MQNVRKLAVFILFVCLVFIIVPGVLSAQEKTVNINTAGIEDLMTLNRIGPAYAQRIIDYREKNGPFQKPEDIVKVKGIGQKTWEANKDRIVVE